jgi:hypothetical protein
VVFDASENIVGITPRCNNTAEGQVKDENGAKIVAKLHGEYENVILSESNIIPCDQM